jgi:hypothetical protein
VTVTALGLLGLHFSHEVDVTGMATVLLALTTAYLARRTGDSVRLGNAELERASRPVLVPHVDRAAVLEVPYTGLRSSEPPVAPAHVGRALWVPVSNVGTGPALQVRATVSFGDIDGQPSTHGIDTRCHAAAAAISNALAYAVLVFPEAPAEGKTGFTMQIEYEDVAGKRWWTEARYSESSKLFHDVAIREFP